VSAYNVEKPNSFRSGIWSPIALRILSYPWSVIKSEGLEFYINDVGKPEFT